MKKRQRTSRAANLAATELGVPEVVLERNAEINDLIEDDRLANMTPEQQESADLASQSREDLFVFREAQKMLSDNSSKLSRSLKSRELGLSLGLLGAAEMQVHRLASINASLGTIETRLMWLAENGLMPLDELIDFYKNLVANAERAGKFVSDTGKSINWDAIKQSVTEVETFQETINTDDEKAAEIDGIKMLRKLTELSQNQNSVPEDK